MSRFYLADPESLLYKGLKVKTIKLYFNNVTGEYFCLSTFREYIVNQENQVATLKPKDNGSKA